jgi:predicted TIM-barrel fold metal-dependent hydrolase
MYGSDWPVSRLAEGVNYEEVIQLLRDVIKDRSDEDKKAIFRQTAINFYSLQDVL